MSAEYRIRTLGIASEHANCSITDTVADTFTYTRVSLVTLRINCPYQNTIPIYHVFQLLRIVILR